MTPTFSTSILHKPGNEARAAVLLDMEYALSPTFGPLKVFDEPAPPPWNIGQHEIHPKVWKWHLSMAPWVTHHLCMTDDLHIAPHFWAILEAMVSAHPNSVIGLLSNHPAAPKLARRGLRWYRTNSWVVGPAYVIPRPLLTAFLPWYEDWVARTPREVRGERGDDSCLNEWVSAGPGGPREAWHPLPTIIEHRGDIATTWQFGGDCFSRERVSWRAFHTAPLRALYTGEWTTTPHDWDLEAMAHESYWTSFGPMLPVGGASEDDE